MELNLSLNRLGNLARRLEMSFGVALRPEYCGLVFTHCWFFSIQRIAVVGSAALFSADTFVGATIICLAMAFAAAHRGANCSTGSCGVMMTLVATTVASLFLVSGGSPLPFVAETLLGLICGVGVGGLYLLWGSFYRRFDIRQTVYILFMTFAIGSLLKMPFELVSPGLSTALLFCLLPAASVGCWIKAAHSPVGPSFKPTPLVASAGRTLARYAVGVAVFSASIGAVSALQGGYYALSLSPVLVLTAHLIEVGVAVSFIAVVYHQREDLGFDNLWMTVLSVIATGLVAVEYLPGAAARVADSILTAAQMMVVIMVWLSLSDISQRCSKPSDVVFGVGYAVYALPLAMTSYLCLLSPLAGSDSILVMYALFLVVLLLMRRRWDVRPVMFPDLAPRVADGGNVLERRVRAVADTYGLTEREEAVALLYAQGRSRQFIGESLCISAHTASDHIAHIYRKLRVHNKQEFIDVFERAGKE